MLTPLGFMFAAYAIFRILAEVLRGPRHYPATALYALTIVFGVIAICIICVCTAYLMSAAGTPTHP